MVVLDWLKRLLSLLSLPGDPERAAKRGLAALLRDIERRGPRWYHPWSNRLDRRLAADFAGLKATAERMGTIYRTTIDQAPEAARPVLERLAERLLAGEGLNLAGLRFDRLRRDAAESAAAAPGGPGADDELEAVDALFKRRLAAFETEAARAAAAGVQLNLRYAALAAFRWDYLSPALAGRASGVPASPLAGDLADLYYLLAGPRPDARTAAAGRAVFLALREEAAPPAYSAAAAEADWAALAAALSGPFAPDGFGRVVRAVHADAAFELREYAGADDFRKTLADSLSADYAARRRAAAERLAAERLETLRAALFGDSPLLPVQGYSAELSGQLAAVQLPEFGSRQPLSVVKSFLAGVYLVRLRPAVSAAIVDLEYSDVGFRSALADAADALGALAEAIGVFERQAEAFARADFLGGLAAGALEAADRAAADRAVRALNREADRLIQETFALGFDLSKRLRTLGGDLKSRRPELVANAQLIALRHPQTAAGLERTAAALDQFTALLRQLAVDSSAARGSVQAKAAAG
jgi:hypothetical protein